MTYYLDDEYEKAIPELEKFYELDRKLGDEFLKINANYVLLGLAYHKTGQYKKEKKLYKTAESILKMILKFSAIRLSCQCLWKIQ